MADILVGKQVMYEPTLRFHAPFAFLRISSRLSFKSSSTARPRLTPYADDSIERLSGTERCFGLLSIRAMSPQQGLKLRKKNISQNS